MFADVEVADRSVDRFEMFGPDMVVEEFQVSSNSMDFNMTSYGETNLNSCTELMH